jgi:DNA polymerase III delta prime subunit
MDFITHIGVPENRLHHFYIIEGSEGANFDLINTALKLRGDVHPFAYSTLGVEDAADIRKHQSERSERPRFILLQTVSITHEAQQTLLKAFEEPKGNTHFFLMMPDATSILPTVRSRAQFIQFKPVSIFTDEAKEFTTLSKEKRIAFIAKFMKSHESDDSSGELRLAASQFIGALIEETMLDTKNLVSKKMFLEDALRMRGYLDSRGASVKMILEHLALTL